MTNATEKKVKDEKTKEEKINEIMADGATVVKMEVDYRWKGAFHAWNLEFEREYISALLATKSCQKLGSLLDRESLQRRWTCWWLWKNKQGAPKGCWMYFGLHLTALNFLMLSFNFRSGADTHSTARVLVTIVQLSFEAGDWPGMIPVTIIVWNWCIAHIYEHLIHMNIRQGCIVLATQ